MLMRDEEDNGIESDEIVSGLEEVTRSDTASSVGSNRHKRGRQGSKRARMVVNKTCSTLLWTEIELVRLRDHRKRYHQMQHL